MLIGGIAEKIMKVFYCTFSGESRITAKVVIQNSALYLPYV